MANINLSIIIAVYSESNSLIETVERLFQKDSGYIKEIILAVSPYSSKECLSICRRLTEKYKTVKMFIQRNNPGQGWAFREGFAIAVGTHVAIMSGDLETDPETVDRMVHKVEETGCDMVAANRWLKGGGFKGYGTLMLILNFVFQRIFMLLFRTPISDLTYGFRVFDIKMIKKIKWECTSHDFCFESILKPIKLGMRIEEVPSKWITRREGRSKNAFLRNFKYFIVGFRIFFADTKLFILNQE